MSREHETGEEQLTALIRQAGDEARDQSGSRRRSGTYIAMNTVMRTA